MSQTRDAPIISASGGETAIRFDSARSARISLTLDPSGGFTIATTVDETSSIQETPVPPASPLVLLAQDRHQVLVAWNATATAIPRLCTHHVFEEQVVATPKPLTRVGFLGRLFPFALAFAMCGLAFAPFRPLSFPLFLPLLLLSRRQRTGRGKVLRPRLWPQGRFRPRFPQPNGGQEAQASARDTAQFASPWPFRPTPRCLTRHMRRGQLVQLLGWVADLGLAADPHHPQRTDRQRQPQALRPLGVEHLGVLPAPLPALVILKPAFDPGA